MKKSFSQQMDYLTEANRMYAGLYRKHKGIFFRGENEGGITGVGFGALGNGTYLTWKEATAKAYANFGKGKVNKYKIKKGLKIADEMGKEVVAVKKMLGFEPWDYTDDAQFNKILTFELKRKKFDGVISDNDMKGIVIFDRANLTLVE